MSSFPKTIFVTHEDEGTDNAFFSISDSTTAEGALKTTERTAVATYELKEVREGKLEPVFSTIVG